jgi:amidase
MNSNRIFGHLRPPTAEQLAAYAEGLDLHPTPSEFEFLATTVSEWLELFFDRIDELEQPAVPLRHTHRDPGRPPRPEEDPHNAVIRFCEVRGSEEGSLAGKKVGIKDCISVAGIPTTNGGRRVPAYVPIEDAVVIERLLDAGAVITAMLNMGDLGWDLGEGSAFGTARNPHNPQFLTGGSSSGAGAAVGDGTVDIALGVDCGGSIRMPAAWCGLVGIKPTHGLVPSYGITYEDHTIDHVGPITRSVADSALALEVIAGHDWRDPQWVRAEPQARAYSATSQKGLDGLRIGVVAEALKPAGCTDEVLEAFAKAVETATGLGATAEPVSVPLWSEALPLLVGVATFGLWAMVQSGGAGFGHLGRISPDAIATMRAQARVGSDHFPPGLKTALVTAEHLRKMYLGVHYGKIQNLRLELRRQINQLFGEHDLLLTPTVTTVAVPRLEGRHTASEVLANAPYQIGANTCPLDLSGHPALTLPCGASRKERLPIGLQIIGSRFGEEAVYQAAFALEGMLAPTSAAAEAVHAAAV